MILITALQRRLRRKAVAKLCEWSSSRCVSDSSRYIRSRAQYAASRFALVKVDLPKGTGGRTGHHHASLSHDGAAHTGGWRRPLLRSVADEVRRQLSGRRPLATLSWFHTSVLLSSPDTARRSYPCAAPVLLVPLPNFYQISDPTHHPPLYGRRIWAWANRSSVRDRRDSN